MRRPSFTSQVSKDGSGRRTPISPEPVDVDNCVAASQDSTDQPAPRIWSSTRKKLTIVCLAIVYFSTCAAFSVLSPFFPNEVSIALVNFFHGPLPKLIS